MTNHQEHFNKAMLGPGDMYRSPKDVAQDERLEVEERLAVLKNWGDDVQQVLTSEGENMKPNRAKKSEADLLQAIENEIEALSK